MKYLVVKDKRKRIKATKFQLKKLYLKSLYLENYNFLNFFSIKFNFFFYYKFYSIFLIFNIKNKGNLSYIKNRCIFTGRSKSIIRFYKVSRIVFREFVANGNLVGVKKSSW